MLDALRYVEVSENVKIGLTVKANFNRITNTLYIHNVKTLTSRQQQHEALVKGRRLLPLWARTVQHVPPLVLQRVPLITTIIDLK